MWGQLLYKLLAFILNAVQLCLQSLQLLYSTGFRLFWLHSLALARIIIGRYKWRHILHLDLRVGRVPYIEPVLARGFTHLLWNVHNMHLYRRRIIAGRTRYFSFPYFHKAPAQAFTNPSTHRQKPSNQIMPVNIASLIVISLLLMVCLFDASTLVRAVLWTAHNHTGFTCSTSRARARSGVVRAVLQSAHAVPFRFSWLSVQPGIQ